MGVDLRRIEWSASNVELSGRHQEER